MSTKKKSSVVEDKLAHAECRIAGLEKLLDVQKEKYEELRKLAVERDHNIKRVQKYAQRKIKIAGLSMLAVSATIREEVEEARQGFITALEMAVPLQDKTILQVPPEMAQARLFGFNALAGMDRLANHLENRGVDAMGEVEKLFSGAPFSLDKK